MSFTDYNRKMTRKERYEAKASLAKTFPIAVATVHFRDEGNAAFVARSVACFGADSLHIIGKMPEAKEFKRLSGGHSETVKTYQYSNAVDLIKYCRDNGYMIVSAEMTDDSVNLYEAILPKNQKIMLIVGHEELGVPVEILHRSDIVVHIPMVGSGWCLNCSQAANIILSEYVRRYGS